MLMVTEMLLLTLPGSAQHIRGLTVDSSPVCIMKPSPLYGNSLLTCQLAKHPTSNAQQAKHLQPFS